MLILTQLISYFQKLGCLHELITLCEQYQEGCITKDCLVADLDAFYGVELRDNQAEYLCKWLDSKGESEINWNFLTNLVAQKGA